MVEIFNYGTSVYERFSQNEKAVKKFQQQLALEKTTVRDVANHAQVLNVDPKPSALSSLLGTNQKISWARFSIPENYHKQRYRTPYLVPSLGDPSSQDLDIEKIVSFLKIITKGTFVYRKQKLVRRLPSHDESHDENKHSFNEDESEKEEESLVKQGESLIELLDSGIKFTNLIIDYIISRMFQFVQG